MSYDNIMMKKKNLIKLQIVKNIKFFYKKHYLLF